MSDKTRVAGMEWIVARLDTVHAAQSALFTEAPRPGRAPREEYTPGDFLRECSSVIAACLGVAALANLLVLLVGG